MQQIGGLQRSSSSTRHLVVEADDGRSLVPSGGTAEFEALVCAVEGTKITCPERFSPIGERVMTETETQAFHEKPELRWPKLDVDGGVSAP